MRLSAWFHYRVTLPVWGDGGGESHAINLNPITFDPTQGYAWPIQLNGHFKNLTFDQPVNSAQHVPSFHRFWQSGLETHFTAAFTAGLVNIARLRRKIHSISIGRAGIIMFALAKYSLHPRSALCHWNEGRVRIGVKHPFIFREIVLPPFECWKNKVLKKIIYIYFTLFQRFVDTSLFKNNNSCTAQYIFN